MHGSNKEFLNEMLLEALRSSPQVKALARLMQHQQHTLNCPANGNPDDETKCTCGRTAALEDGWKALEQVKL